MSEIRYTPERAAPSDILRPLPIYRFDPTKTGLERWLGELQTAIMLLMWGGIDHATTKRVWRAVQRGGSPVAYTTVMTTMARLWERGMLCRTKAQYSYVYHTRETRADFEARQLAAIKEAMEETR